MRMGHSREMTGMSCGGARVSPQQTVDPKTAPGRGRRVDEPSWRARTHAGRAQPPSVAHRVCEAADPPRCPDPLEPIAEGRGERGVALDSRVAPHRNGRCDEPVRYPAAPGQLAGPGQI